MQWVLVVAMHETERLVGEGGRGRGRKGALAGREREDGGRKLAWLEGSITGYRGDVRSRAFVGGGNFSGTLFALGRLTGRIY